MFQKSQNSSISLFTNVHELFQKCEGERLLPGNTYFPQSGNCGFVLTYLKKKLVNGYRIRIGYKFLKWIGYEFLSKWMPDTDRIRVFLFTSSILMDIVSFTGYVYQDIPGYEG